MNETKSEVILSGKIEGIDRNDRGYGFRTGTTKSGKKYNSIRFNLRTSPNNLVQVECFGMERDEVTFFKEGEQGKSVRVPWSKRFANKEGFFSFPERYDVASDLAEKNNGDTIRIRGRIQPEHYVNRNGDDVVNLRVQIDRYFEEDAIGFEDENFEESNLITMDIIFGGTMDIGSETFVSGWVVDYRGKSYATNFKVENPEKIKSLKKAKKGQLCQVFAKNVWSSSGGGQFEQKLVQTENGMELVAVGSNDNSNSYRGIVIIGLKPGNATYPLAEVASASVTKKEEEAPVKPKEEEKPEEDSEDSAFSDDDFDALFKELEEEME